MNYVPTASVQQIADVYAEKRSDVTDMLERLIETGSVDETLAEHRYAIMKLPVELPIGSVVVYDTLTTLFTLIDPETGKDIVDPGAIDVDYEDEVIF